MKTVYLIFPPKEAAVKTARPLLSWLSVPQLGHKITAVWSCVSLSAEHRGCGKNLGARVVDLSRADYSRWHGDRPRGLGGKQPRPEKPRQALMPRVILWISTFLGDTRITWLMGSRSYVYREELFNLKDCSFDGASLGEAADRCAIKSREPSANSLWWIFDCVCVKASHGVTMNGYTWMCAGASVHLCVQRTLKLLLLCLYLV